jgi:extracellular elastinolytic metalloproteinase
VRPQVARRTSALGVTAATILAVGLGQTAAPQANAAPRTGKPVTSVTPSKHVTSPAGEPHAAQPRNTAFYDAREGATAVQAHQLAAKATLASSRPATDRLRSTLGKQSVLQLDGLTGTVDQLGKFNGFLTARSSAPAAKVATDYIGKHLAALGLRGADMNTFRLSQSYVDVAGIHHLSWTQTVGGIHVFGNGLKANVTRDGRLLSLGGAPVSGMRVSGAAGGAVSSKAAAIAAARRDTGEASLKAGPEDYAQRVLFAMPSGLRHAWEAITMSADRPMQTVVDAANGRVLYRRDLSNMMIGPSPVRTRATGRLAQVAERAQAHTASLAAAAAATRGKKPRRGGAVGLAFEYFPGHKPGGRAQPVNYSRKGWLKARAKRLVGNNSHTYADVNDNNKPSRNEEIRPKSPRNFKFRLQPFHLRKNGMGKFCDNPWPCSWNPNKAFSWKVNRDQNATQVFYFVNKWHDHLKAKPIGFTEAAGNFQEVNRSGKGKGGDSVITQTDDGANTARGLPDGNHVDNANMATPPDGRRPRMQMYLQHAPFTPYSMNGDPWSPTNVGDEADTVYHEYTHGLTHRMVIDADGNATLSPVQGDAMGEGWSDWYAMDYLVQQGLQKDGPGVDVVIFQYDGLGALLDRFQPMDCKVDSPARACPGGETGHKGGFTYADYGQVLGSPEVHSDGEIWAETLWDIRDAFGSKTAEALITRGLSLASDDPSFLDMRDGIMQADRAIYDRAHQERLWRIFARRGMGFYAGSLGSRDVDPGASFRMPPPSTAKGVITGTVTDSKTGDPVEGATVTLAFQRGGVKNPSVTTDAGGVYTLPPVPQGVYPKLSISARGYDAFTARVNVSGPSVTKDGAIDRDWVARKGGATITKHTGFTAPRGCNWTNLNDQSQVTGWVTAASLSRAGHVTAKTPKQVTIHLPEAVDIDRISVDPTAACNVGLSAATGQYRIETSTDGVNFATAAQGTFLVDNRGHLNDVTLTGNTTGVTDIRFWILKPMVLVDTDAYPDGCADPTMFGGCTFMSASEMEVYGAPAGP